MFDTNLWGTIVTCREALTHFGNDGGSITNIGSMSSERFSAGAVAYPASKAGITGVSGRAGSGACLARHPRQSNQSRVGWSALARRRKQQRRDSER